MACWVWKPLSVGVSGSPTPLLVCPAAPLMSAMTRTLYIIDGHAQIFRAYYAPFQNLTSPSGEPTRATHVFFQTLLNLVRDRKPDYLAMALDVSDETVFRRDFYPEYKAHRDPAPEDFGVQADRIVTILQAAQIPILRVGGFEADDVMATLAKRLASPDLHVYLVSKDKDLEQLLNDWVSLFDPGKNDVITPQKLFESKGWTPAQAVDAQTLIGDTVDNVPGVNGIGPKTAAKLLEKYGSAAAVLEHADELTPKMRDAVKAFAAQIDITRRLVTLRDDVPVELDLEACRCERFDWPEMRAQFQGLGFRRLPELVPVPADAPPRKAEPRAVESVATAATGDGAPTDARSVLAAKLSQPTRGQYELINKPERFKEFAAELAQQPAFALDTETTSVNPVDAELVGLSFSWRPGTGYFLPTRSLYGETLPLVLVREKLAPIFADAKKLKVGQNIKYDMIVLRQHEMPVAGPHFDTMIAGFVLEPTERSYGADKLTERYFGHTMIPITDLIGKGRDQISMDQVPLEQITEYASEDADYTWRLKELFEPQLRDSDVSRLFYEVEMPLVSVLCDMEFNGITIDTDALGEMSKRLSARVEQIIDEAHRVAGERFNLDSPKQLGEILFDKLGFRVVKKTKTARSTDADTLEVLAAETGHPLLKLLLEHRELQKLRGTYVDALPKSRSRRTGRVHTSYHQTGAVTGRLSSSEPNLQNIPIRTDLGREIRRAFVPRGADEVLISADYSQIELRVLAHFCQDEQLIRAFEQDHDVHTFVAAQIAGVPLEAVTREMRGRAKAVNFGIIYGQTAFGLAQGTGMSRSDAQKFIDDYFARYPRIRGFIQQCIQDGQREGFVRTILGRRRPLPDIHSQNRALRALSERLAVNTVIQGSAADLIKLAMIQLDRRIRESAAPLRILLQVHDELVCEAVRSRAEEMAELVRSVMSTAMPLRVPLKVDAAIADNWLDAK